MKRFLALLAVAAAAAGLAPRAKAQGITAAPGGQASSLAGLAFDVPIVVDMGARSDKLGAFAARLTWNPSRLRLDATSAGTFGSVTISPDSLPQGILNVAGANPAGAAGQVSLGMLRFTPLLPDTATMVLTFSELFAAQTFADLLPNLTVSSRQFCPARGRFGDIDLDGTAGSRDALIALSAAVGISVAPLDTLLGDVDGNQATNARDALGILTHAVGLPTPGFRVLAMALGSCAIGGPVTLQLSPGVTGTLVLGQQITFEARASDGSGGLQSIPDAIWRSSDPTIVAVGPGGTAGARGAGTALVTAVRAGQDSASISITVVNRRTRHFVDAAALQSANVTGSAALPFGHLRDAVLAAQDGDTIQMRPGRYEPALAAVSVPRLVIVGDTLPSGQRPTISGTGVQTGGFGLSIIGATDVQIIDIGFDALLSAVTVQGAGRLRMAGIHGSALGNVLLSSGPLQHFRLEKSRITGDFQAFLPAISMLGPVDTLVISDTDLSDFGREAVMAMDVDSVAILRSRINRFGGEGLQLDPIEARGRGLALVIDSSEMRRFAAEVVEASEVRSLVARWSVFESFEDLFQLFTVSGHGFIKLQNDSLIMFDNNNWMDAEGFDSVVVDSVKAKLDGGFGWFYNIGFIRVARSVFEGADYVIEAGLGGTGSFNRTGGRLEMRNTDVSGETDCDRCGYGIEAFDDYRVIVDSSTFTNLDAGVEAFTDSNVTVTNSRFRHVWTAIEMDGSYNVGCASCGGNPGVQFTGRFNTIEGAERGFSIDDALILVDSNTIRDVEDEAIEVGSYASVIVTRNRIFNTGQGIDADLFDSSGVMTIEDNVMTGMEFVGVRAFGENFPDTLSTRINVRRNAITCNGYVDSYGVDVSDGDLMVADNAITGCGNGVSASYFGTTVIKTDSILRNRIQLPIGANSGIYVTGDLRTVIRGNHVSGPATAGNSTGMIRVDGPSTGTGTSARVDHDTVAGGQRYGVAIRNVDSASVQFNQINDVQTSTFGNAGVTVEGTFADTVRIRGNAIRRASADAVYLRNSGTGTMLFDSNLVSHSGADGLRLDAGAYVIRRSSVDSSRHIGIELTSALTVATLDSNNIQGNVSHGVQTNGSGATGTATNNWWGHPTGPRCLSACAGGAGDSVDATVPFAPFLTAPAGGAPIGVAPPAIRPIAQAGTFALTTPAVREARMPRARPVRQRPAATVESRPDVSRLGEAAGRQLLARHQSSMARDAERERRRAAILQARAAELQRDAERQRQDESRREARQALLRAARSRP